METIKSSTQVTQGMLEIVKDGFEEQKGIHVVSIYEWDGNIYGIYVVNLYDSLSFLRVPLTNMHTDIEGHNIFMMELGLLLKLIYDNGSMQMFNILTHPSSINCSSDYFSNLVNFCSLNPPLQLSSFHLIKWIERLNDGDLNMSTDDLIEMVENFLMVEELNVDVSDKTNEVIIKNNLNLILQKLREKKYKKITEAIMNKVDYLFVQLQLDLYMTDDK